MASQRCKAWAKATVRKASAHTIAVARRSAV
jgi:hypothetical protein